MPFIKIDDDAPAPEFHLDGDALTVERSGHAARAHRDARRGVPLRPVRMRRQTKVAELLEQTAGPVRAGAHGDLRAFTATFEEPTC